MIFFCDLEIEIRFFSAKFALKIWNIISITKKLNRNIQILVIIPRNNSYKIRFYNSTDLVSGILNVDIIKHEIPAPATRNNCFEPLQIWYFNEFLFLPYFLQYIKIPVAGTRRSTSKTVPKPSIFNNFECPIVLARRHGANFAKLNFQKNSEFTVFLWFWHPNRFRARAWCKFCWRLGQPILQNSRFSDLALRTLENKKILWKKTQHFVQYQSAKISHMSHLCCKISLLSNFDVARPNGNF